MDDNPYRAPEEVNLLDRFARRPYDELKKRLRGLRLRMTACAAVLVVTAFGAMYFFTVRPWQSNSPAQAFREIVAALVVIVAMTLLSVGMLLHSFAQYRRIMSTLLNRGRRELEDTVAAAKIGREESAAEPTPAKDRPL